MKKAMATVTTWLNDLTDLLKALIVFGIVSGIIWNDVFGVIVFPNWNFKWKRIFVFTLINKEKKITNLTIFRFVDARFASNISNKLNSS